MTNRQNCASYQIPFDKSVIGRGSAFIDSNVKTSFLNWSTSTSDCRSKKCLFKARENTSWQINLRSWQSYSYKLGKLYCCLLTNKKAMSLIQANNWALQFFMILCRPYLLVSLLNAVLFALRSKRILKLALKKRCTNTEVEPNLLQKIEKRNSLMEQTNSKTWAV
jgi:hypothetical protein